MKDVEEYGSPNVFGEFQPHVSIGWGRDASAVASAVAALKKRLQPSTFVGDLVAMGTVGDHGTVLKNEDLGIWNVTNRQDFACRKAYSVEAACDADNVTSGGCVWCDVVDQPPFCTTKTNARTIPNPPQYPPHHCTGDNRLQ
jgi:hypothetical protein